MNDTYLVYVQTDSTGNITNINSSDFIANVTGWTQVDQGKGDKYHHAQNNYLPKRVLDERGCHNYKMVNGVITEKTDAEKQTEFNGFTPQPPSIADRLSSAEQAIIALMGV